MIFPEASCHEVIYSTSLKPFIFKGPGPNITFLKAPGAQKAFVLKGPGVFGDLKEKSGRGHGWRLRRRWTSQFTHLLALQFAASISQGQAKGTEYFNERVRRIGNRVLKTLLLS